MQIARNTFCCLSVCKCQCTITRDSTFTCLSTLQTVLIEITKKWLHFWAFVELDVQSKSLVNFNKFNMLWNEINFILFWLTVLIRKRFLTKGCLKFQGDYWLFRRPSTHRCHTVRMYTSVTPKVMPVQSLKSATHHFKSQHNSFRHWL